ncbi:Catalase-related peroxidase [Burkholderia sp. AD24]|nr:Catalase-related peroxidase [Burkholderia sp. AD24]
MSDWKEVYDGGSPEAEKDIFLEMAKQMLGIQEGTRLKLGKDRPDRTLHSKMIAGVTNASIVVDSDIPESFRVSYFQPDALLPVAVRFSNASAIAQPDSAPDMRGIALKIFPEGSNPHDLLMTSFPVSHARNSRQFVDFAVLAQGPRETFMQRLVARFGEDEAKRMIGNIQQGARPCESLALQRFWSRGAFLWGSHPVRFELRPVSTSAALEASSEDVDALRSELALRLRAAPVSFRLAVQPFVDEASTPIEDAAVQWQEEVSAPVEIATLLIPAQNLDDSREKAADQVNSMAFNPWNAPPEFRPLGNLNRVRGVVYGKSAERWQHKQ